MSRPSSWRWPQLVTSLNYALALLIVAAAVVFAQLLAGPLDTNPIVSLFLCGIMFVAWFGGAGPAWLAAVILALACIAQLGRNDMRCKGPSHSAYR
jgi:K+-sensing histidine kinase KdpD